MTTCWQYSPFRHELRSWCDLANNPGNDDTWSKALYN